MNIKKSVLLGWLAAFTFPSMTFADLPNVAPLGGNTSERVVNRGYVGLEWVFGKGPTPAMVIGFRHAKVDSTGDSHGGDVSFSFDVFNGFQAGKIRTKYFNGQDEVQGEIGAGFDFSNGFFVGAGVKAPFTNIGVDYLFSPDRAWQPYFRLDSLKRYNKPQETSGTTCPFGYIYVPATGLCDFDA